MHQKLLLDKISSVLAVTDQANAAKLLKLLDEAGRIFVGGAGRSGLVSRCFAMRLVHSGYQVNMVGEIVTPAIKAGDLFLVISGSGGTKTLLPLLETAKSKGAKIVVISMKNKSPMSDMADLTVQIGNDDAFGLTKGMPMGTTFELSTLVYLEAVISELIHAKGLTEEGMRAIHANLE
jgi:6-phospho-3-hexuloisomerase